MTNTLQTMESAPLDGTFVLLFGDSGVERTNLTCQLCRFINSRWKTVDGERFKNKEGTIVEPLYWFPMPEVPAPPPYLLVMVIGQEDGSVSEQHLEQGSFDEISTALLKLVDQQTDTVKYQMEKVKPYSAPAPEPAPAL